MIPVLKSVLVQAMLRKEMALLLVLVVYTETLMLVLKWMSLVLVLELGKWMMMVALVLRRQEMLREWMALMSVLLLVLDGSTVLVPGKWMTAVLVLVEVMVQGE
jgi:hypothetical protein